MQSDILTEFLKPKTIVVYLYYTGFCKRTSFRRLVYYMILAELVVTDDANHTNTHFPWQGRVWKYAVTAKCHVPVSLVFQYDILPPSSRTRAGIRNSHSRNPKESQPSQISCPNETETGNETTSAAAAAAEPGTRYHAPTKQQQQQQQQPAFFFPLANTVSGGGGVTGTYGDTTNATNASPIGVTDLATTLAESRIPAHQPSEIHVGIDAVGGDLADGDTPDASKRVAHRTDRTDQLSSTLPDPCDVVPTDDEKRCDAAPVVEASAPDADTDADVYVYRNERDGRNERNAPSERVGEYIRLPRIVVSVPVVSVVMSTYNCAKYIEFAVRSIQLQT
jgi:hypothetical protein